MKTYYGRDKVEKGVYLNVRNGEFIQLYGDVRILPGDTEVKYVKTPGALAVIAGPVAGLAFVIFLPLVGIIGIGAFFAYKIRDGAVALAHRATRPEPVEQNLETIYHVQEAAKDIERYIDDDEPDEV
jgi:hypothetical protein